MSVIFGNNNGVIWISIIFILLFLGGVASVGGLRTDNLRARYSFDRWQKRPGAPSGPPVLIK